VEPAAPAAGTLLPGLSPSAPPPPSAVVPPSFRRTGLVVGAIVVALLLVVAGLQATVFRTSSYPSGWDARLGDLPATVARLRGLSFEHPVPVRFETAARFVHEGAIGADEQTAGQKRATKRLTEELRAVGLISGDVDLFGATRTERANRVLAFYDPDAKEIVIRGRHLDVPHRVVLAHELTHVLQDQHFDLPRLEASVRHAPGQSSDALRAVVEGDAVRIEHRYVDSLSRADQASYEAWERAGVDGADQATRSVPAVLTVLDSAPYAYGPSVLRVLSADGGNGAVDRAFEHGVFTQKLFVEPTASLTDPAPKPIAAPAPAAGEKTVDAPEQLGAFDLYLMLGSRIDAADALDTAAHWTGGRMRTVRAGGATCVRGRVTVDSTAARRDLDDRMRRWVAALPPGMASVTTTGTHTDFRSCDPGAASPLAPPDPAITRADALLAAHDEIEVALVAEAEQAGAPVATARCAALGLVRAPEVAALLARPEDQVSQAEVDAALRAAGPRVGRACGI
jgi:hypothetical protein